MRIVTEMFSFLDKNPPTHELVAAYLGFKPAQTSSETFTAELGVAGAQGQRVKGGKNQIPDFVKSQRKPKNAR